MLHKWMAVLFLSIIPLTAFTDINEDLIKAVPTFYINSTYGFSLEFPIAWEDWVVDEQLINHGYGVKAPVVYFGLPDQKEIFAVSIFTKEQWDQLSKVEPPDGVSGDPVARNNSLWFDYSLGHYAANEDMYKRRGEVGDIMKTMEVTTAPPGNE